MKILGGALIFLGFLAAGLVHTSAEKKRIETLCQLVLALELMEGELSARRTPLPELTALLANRSTGQAGAFFRQLADSMEQLGDRSFDTLWSRAAENLNALDRGEREELIRLGPVLGRFEMDKQLAALGCCCSALREALRGAQSRYPDKQRLSLGLTAAAGALLIIALL